MTYEQWMKAVDQEVYKIAGVSVHDLGDFLSRDAYNEDASPEEGAQEALANDDLFSSLVT